MALQTSKFQFVKPELTDSPPDITVTNSNWDLVDILLEIQNFVYVNSSMNDDFAISIRGIEDMNSLFGIIVKFSTAIANNGACTLNVNSLGAFPILKWGTVALASRDVLENAIIEVAWNGANFQLLNPTGDVRSDGTTLLEKLTVGSRKAGSVEGEMSVSIGMENDVPAMASVVIGETNTVSGGGDLVTGGGNTLVNVSAANVTGTRNFAFSGDLYIPYTYDDITHSISLNLVHPPLASETFNVGDEIYLIFDDIHEAPVVKTTIVSKSGNSITTGYTGSYEYLTHVARCFAEIAQSGFIQGNQNVVEGFGRVLGLGNTVANGSTVIGDGNEITHRYVQALGEGLKSARIGSILMGQYNDPKPGDLFEVGGGSDDSHRANFIELNEDGDIKFADDVVAGDGSSLKSLNSTVIISNQETVGSGVIYNTGGAVTAQSTPNMTVSVSTCTAYMPTGERAVISAVASQAITTADATNPRKDIMYVNSSKVTSYLVGTASATPVAPLLPSGGVLLAEIYVGAGVTSIANANIADKRQIIKSNADLTVSTHYKTMGVAIDLSNSNPLTSVVYTDDAIGMGVGSKQWDDFFGHYPCILKDGVETTLLNPNDFTKDIYGNTVDLASATVGDVMIAFPRLGLKINTYDTTVYIKMTNNPDDSTYEYNAHTRGTVRKDKFYLGAYKGYVDNSKLRSWSGKTPTASQTIGAFRTRAQANGTGYENSGFYQLIFRQCMYILKYKNLNSQTALGRGYVDGNSATINTGGTNAKGMDFGEATGKLQMKLFCIEDFWGNIHEWIDGLVTDASRNMLTANSYFNDTGAGYTNNGQGATADIGNYMFKPQGGTKTGFIAKEVSGSETTYFCDYAILSASCVTCFGGTWSNASTAGAFRLDVSSAASYSNAGIAARLMYL